MPGKEASVLKLVSDGASGMQSRNRYPDGLQHTWDRACLVCRKPYSDPENCTEASVAVHTPNPNIKEDWQQT